jgi:hypothetical protein
MNSSFEQQQPEGNSAGIEKHVQTILVAITTAAILFSATFTFSSSKDIALLAQQVSALTVQVASMQAKLDSNQQMYITRSEFRDHEERLRYIESHAKK